MIFAYILVPHDKKVVQPTTSNFAIIKQLKLIPCSPTIIVAYTGDQSAPIRRDSFQLSEYVLILNFGLHCLLESIGSSLEGMIPFRGISALQRFHIPYDLEQS